MIFGYYYFMNLVPFAFLIGFALAILWILAIMSAALWRKVEAWTDDRDLDEEDRFNPLDG